MLTQQNNSVVGMYLEDVNWSEIKTAKRWLEQYNNLEASSLVTMINELWNEEAMLYWDMLNAQKDWLNTIENPLATRLINFIELVQSRAHDFDDSLFDVIYNRSTSVPQTKAKNNPLKLVVSNYFTPRERLDRPFPPAPELTILK